MMYAGDPLDAFYRYDSDQAEAQDEYERACPVCQICGERITDDYCYCLSPSSDMYDTFRSCVHITCIKTHRVGHGDRMNELIRWLIEDTCYSRTPIKEGEIDG